MKDRMSPREHAEALVEYYVRLSERHPKEEEYPLGRALAERWLSLIAAPKPEPDLVAALLKDVDIAECREDAGSGIADLNLSIHAWARSSSAR